LAKSKLSRGNKSAATRRATNAAKGSRAARSSTDPSKIAALTDDALLEIVQRQTFRYFWEGAHPVSGLAFDRRTSRKRIEEVLIRQRGGGVWAEGEGEGI